MADGHIHTHGNRRALGIALAITVTFALVELAGGLLAGSLALIADAAHMGTDVLALGLSLFAAWAATRPSTSTKTFGYYRAEILAALVNGAALVAIAGWILWEAGHRLAANVHVAGTPMIVVGLAGLAANLASATVLFRSERENLNIHGALLHVAGDAAGAAGAVVAGIILLAVDWHQADPLVSLVIAGLILLSSWRLLRESVDVLLEGTPARINMPELETAMLAVPGVAAVHDVHVWTVTSGFVAMSGHAVVDGSCDDHQLLDTLTRMLTRRFAIRHVTIQPEPTLHDGHCVDIDCQPEKTRAAVSAGHGHHS